jgi:deazaflavin-dependent oxidoreductase (nitroreductase family)
MAEPATSPANDFNRSIIEEFRGNGGRVGGPFEGATLLLLTTTGAKTGRAHTTPVAYARDGDRYLVFASKAGAPTNPAWYHNLRAHSRARVEVGGDAFDVDAEVLTGAERDRHFQAQAERTPQFAGYQAKTTRKIPVIALTRA